LARIVPPASWNASRHTRDWDTTFADITIPSPINQYVGGLRGVFQQTNVMAKPMKVPDFRKAALAREEAIQGLSDEELERRFWKTILYDPPQYGADMRGSLFDKDEKHWNVDNLGSILNCLDVELTGVTTSYLYFGMWRAMFAWHTEDMDLNSINYLHYGAPKHWYAIPVGNRDKFERMAQDFFPDLSSQCDQFLRHKTTMISPAVLRQNDVSVYTTVQQPGEFVITFPGVYHAGFNHGFNCAEAVNFATESWIADGLRAGVCRCVRDSVKINMGEFLNCYLRFALTIEPQHAGEQHDAANGDCHSSSPHNATSICFKRKPLSGISRPSERSTYRAPPNTPGCGGRMMANKMIERAPPPPVVTRIVIKKSSLPNKHANKPRAAPRPKHIDHGYNDDAYYGEEELDRLLDPESIAHKRTKHQAAMHAAVDDDEFEHVADESYDSSDEEYTINLRTPTSLSSSTSKAPSYSFATSTLPSNIRLVVQSNKPAAASKKRPIIKVSSTHKLQATNVSATPAPFADSNNDDSPLLGKVSTTPPLPSTPSTPPKVQSKPTSKLQALRMQATRMAGIYNPSSSSSSSSAPAFSLSTPQSPASKPSAKSPTPGTKAQSGNSPTKRPATQQASTSPTTLQSTVCINTRTPSYARASAIATHNQSSATSASAGKRVVCPNCHQFTYSLPHGCADSMACKSYSSCPTANLRLHPEEIEKRKARLAEMAQQRSANEYAAPSNPYRATGSWNAASSHSTLPQLPQQQHQHQQYQQHHQQHAQPLHHATASPWMRPQALAPPGLSAANPPPHRTGTAPVMSRPRVGLGAVPPPRHQSPVAQSTLAPPGLQPPGISSPPLVPPGMPSTGLQPPGLQPPGLQPPGLQPLGLQPPGLQPPGLQPPGLQPPGMNTSLPVPKPVRFVSSTNVEDRIHSQPTAATVPTPDTQQTITAANNKRKADECLDDSSSSNGAKRQRSIDDEPPTSTSV
jgi:hypothetical protein